MTRKDFEAVAAALKHSRLEGHGLNSASQKYIREQWELSVRSVEKVFQAANPRFDSARFLAACGLES